MSKKIILSKRLQQIYQEIPQNVVLADIGSDHAYLPCYACLHGKIKRAICGEVARGPLERTKETIQKYGLTNVIDVRFGDGLEILHKGEVDVIVLAGMGGSLIASILEKGKSVLTPDQRLLLAPNNEACAVRRWLYENDQELKKEKIFVEGSRIYELLVAEKGDPRAPYRDEIELELQFLLGPLLLRESSAVFREKWLREINKWKKIVSQLERAASTVEAENKKHHLQQKIQKVEGCIH